MGLLETVQHLYTYTVTLEPFAGLDSYGALTYGTAVPYRARIQQRARRMRTAQGEEVTSMTQCFLYPTPPVLTAQDRITLPAPFVPAQPPILGIQQSVDMEGALVASVWC